MTSVIDGRTNTLVMPIEVGTDPSSVAINPNTNTIYVANYDEDTVSVIDSKTNIVVKTITVGSGPAEITINPNTNMIYVLNYDTDTVSVIDGKADNHVMDTLIVGKDPVRDFTVNPSSNILYVIDSGNIYIKEKVNKVT